MPSGRPARVPHQGAVLGLCWSDLDDVKLVLGLLDVYVKVMLLRTVLTAICGWARWAVCIKTERRRYVDPFLAFIWFSEFILDDFFVTW